MNHELACERAEQTLLLFLSPHQKSSYHRYQSFRVTGSHGTLYRISCEHYSGNVDWITDTGYVKGNLCGHSGRDYYGRTLPTVDHCLAQMLSLVTDEIAWLRIAHVMNGDYPPVYYRTLNAQEAEPIAYRYCRCRRTLPQRYPAGYYCGRCGNRADRND